MFRKSIVFTLLIIAICIVVCIFCEDSKTRVNVYFEDIYYCFDVNNKVLSYYVPGNESINNLRTGERKDINLDFVIDIAVSDKFVYYLCRNDNIQPALIVRMSFDGKIISKCELMYASTINYVDGILFVGINKNDKRPKYKLKGGFYADLYIVESEFGNMTNDLHDDVKTRDVNGVKLKWSSERNTFIYEDNDDGVFDLNSMYPFFNDSDEVTLEVKLLRRYASSNDIKYSSLYLNEYKADNIIYGTCDYVTTDWYPRIYTDGREINKSIGFLIDVVNEKLIVPGEAEKCAGIICDKEYFVYTDGASIYRENNSTGERIEIKRLSRCNLETNIYIKDEYMLLEYCDYDEFDIVKWKYD